MPRDYRRERLIEGKKRKEERKARGRARTLLGMADGDPGTVSHKKPLSKGGSNAKSNLTKTTNRKNSQEGGRLGARGKKPKHRGGKA